MIEDARPASGLMETFVVRVRSHPVDGEASLAGFVQHVRSGGETRFAGVEELLAALRPPQPGESER